MKALYYFDQSGQLTPREYTVLKKHENGNVDLGPEGGEAKVTECQITETPTNGCAVLIEDAKPKEEKPKDKEKAK